MLADVQKFQRMKIENSCSLEFSKFFILLMDHISLQLLITTIILVSELASLEPVGDDPT